MKYFFLYFITLISIIPSIASNKFSLIGTLNNGTIKYVVLEYWNSNNAYIRDTSYIKNNTFYFSGEINEPQMVDLFAEKKDRSYNGKNQVSFFLDPGISKIYLQENRFKKFKHSGLVTQNELEAFRIRFNNMEDSISTVDSLMKFFYSKGSKSLDDSIKSVYYSTQKIQLQSRELQNQLTYIKDNPNSHLSLYFLKTLVDKLDFTEVVKLYNILSDSIRNTFSARGIKSQIDLIVRSGPNNKMFNIKSIDVNSQTFELEDHLYKSNIIIHFWASWCIPCIEEIEALIPAYNELDTSLCKIFFLSIDESEDDWKRGIRKHNLDNYIHLRMPCIMRDFYVNGIPLVLLIDKNGIIKSRIETNSDSNITAILKFIGK